jgi:uncharacterized protein YbjT (DUF2867 family)
MEAQVMDALNVLVLGGNGFVGRHAVAALGACGHRVIIGSRYTTLRDQSSARAGRPAPAVRQVKLHRLLSAQDWLPLLADVDVVLNCVGILRERPGERYDAVHHRAPAALASACSQIGKRLIHVSALGLSPQARSGFIRSKLDGERALRAAAPDCVIVRPSLLDGDGGFGARWLRALARSPVHPLPAGAVARARMAPLSVRDLGEALARLCDRDCGGPRTLEFGGPASLGMREYLAALRAPHRGRAWCVEVPHWLARLASHLCDLLHWSPYSFGHLELMSADNLPAINALPTILGRAPAAVGSSAAALHADADAAPRQPAPAYPR